MGNCVELLCWLCLVVSIVAKCVVLQSMLHSPFSLTIKAHHEKIASEKRLDIHRLSLYIADMAKDKKLLIRLEDDMNRKLQYIVDHSDIERKATYVRNVLIKKHIEQYEKEHGKIK